MASSQELQLGTSMRCAKCMLLVISIMFAITAVLLIMVGTAIQGIFGDFSQFLDSHFSSPPALLIATGFILLAVSIWGAYGAVKDSVLLINIYGVFLFLVFILEVAAAIAAFVMQGQVRGMLIRTMNNSMELYEYNDYIQSGVDFMQSALECCGIEDPSDWKPYWSENNNNNHNNNNSSMSDFDNSNNIYVPPSCCGRFSYDNPMVCEDKFMFGCLNRMDFIISQSSMLIAMGATSVASVQLLGALCAFMLAKTLRRNKSIREARRWQLQQSLGVLISGGKAVPPTNSPLGYTQLEKSDHLIEHYPITYNTNSPSVN